MKSTGRRTRRACDACRVSKVKCSGTVPCDHCLSSNIPCIAELKSSDTGQQTSSQRQTQYLLFERTRLTRALQQLYRQILSGEPWPGEPVTELPFEGPSIHEILQRLEGENHVEYESGLMDDKKKLGLAAARPGNQDANAETSAISSSTKVFMPTPMLTPAVDAPFADFKTPFTALSTTRLSATSLSGPSIHSDDSPISTSTHFGDICLPPWSFYTQPMDGFVSTESSRFGEINLYQDKEGEFVKELGVTDGVKNTGPWINTT